MSASKKTLFCVFPRVLLFRELSKAVSYRSGRWRAASLITVAERDIEKRNCYLEFYNEEYHGIKSARSKLTERRVKLLIVIVAAPEFNENTKLRATQPFPSTEPSPQSAATYRETFKPTFPSWVAFKIRVERHACAGRGLPAGDLLACHLAGYPGTSMPGHADTSA